MDQGRQTPRDSERIDGQPLGSGYRFTVKLRAHSAALVACIDRVAESLRAELPEYGRDVAIDASDLPAYANGQREGRHYSCRPHAAAR